VSEPARRGRPRNAETDALVLRTTLELLADEGLRGLTVERVAARAGVARTTVYRRFATRDELVTAALRTLAFATLPDIDTGSARGDYVRLIRLRAEQAPTTRWNLLLPRLVVDSAGDPQLAALVDQILVLPQRAFLAALLRRGIERGELPADLDLELAVDVLLGPLVYRILIDRGDLGRLAGLPERVYDLFAAGTAAPTTLDS
jgi:AcrR family transcriptional regulator